MLRRYRSSAGSNPAPFKLLYIFFSIVWNITTYIAMTYQWLKRLINKLSLNTKFSFYIKKNTNEKYMCPEFELKIYVSTKYIWTRLQWSQKILISLRKRIRHINYSFFLTYFNKSNDLRVIYYSSTAFRQAPPTESGITLRVHEEKTKRNYNKKRL